MIKFSKIALATLLIVCASTAAQAEKTKPITLTAKAFGGITAKTTYDLTAIQALFPADEVREAKGMTEGMEYPMLEIVRDHKVVAALLPTADGQQPEKVMCVATNSKEVRQKFGVKIGDSYRKVYKGQMAPGCMAGMEEMSGQVICPAMNASSIYYVFTGKWDGVDGTVPPVTVMQKHFTLQQIIWLPDARKKQALATYCRVNAS